MEPYFGNVWRILENIGLRSMLKLKMIVCSSNISCLAKGQGKELWSLTLKPAVLYCQGRNTVDSNVQNVYDILY